MLYPKNQTPELNRQLFEDPTSEYRCAPFWAWNAVLEPEELKRQIEVFKEMGMGGFHMHCRSGLATPYLSDDFMQLIHTCVDKAKDEHMLAWLYDEDRWPSGAAGGLVTKDHAYRGRYLRLTPIPYGKGAVVDTPEPRREDGKLLAVYDIVLDDSGCLEKYRRCREDEDTEGTKWYAYVEVLGDNPWYNNQAYLDTLNPKAVKRFVEVTHARYAEALGDDLGETSPAIFTDEPQINRKRALPFADAKEDITLPWTDDFPDTFRVAYGFDILDALPELIWQLPENTVSAPRYDYHDHISERFASAFADTIGQWCDKHNLLMTGHLMEEPTLESQTCALGDAMRSYRSFSLPGIDMLCDKREFTTAKQAQSASHQYGRAGVMSELYGVTNWDFDFRGHKLQGDWQAAMGITVRVPHLSWYSMGGIAKRDYPASISYQSPWWKEYSYVENHFARVNTAMTRGKPMVHIGIVHPIESYWLLWGPNDQTYARRTELDTQFQALTNWMVEGLQDFDFLCESLLPQQCPIASAPLQVGEMAYDTIIVPNCTTLRRTTMDRLEAFRAAGGRLIFLGSLPSCVDALPDAAPIRLAARAEVVDFTECALMEALAGGRFVDVINDQGIRVRDMTYQLRQDGKVRWLFLAHTYKPANQDICPGEKCTVKLKGIWHGEIYDTLTGDIKPLPLEYGNDVSLLNTVFYPHDSLLLRLEEGEENTEKTDTPAYQYTAWASGKVPVTLSEPNMFVLDMPEYALDNGEYLPSEEILRIDGLIRKQIGYPQLDGSLAQPWVIPDDGSRPHTVRLRFRIQSEIPVEGVSLAVERGREVGITLNGQPVPATIQGWYTDKAIQIILLPGLIQGENMLELRVPISPRNGLEWCYLLGDFGVRVGGDTAVVVSPVRELAFGDWTVQGLPFYGGNVTYHMEEMLPEDFALEAAHFRAPLLSVTMDGTPLGRIAYAPYRLPVHTTAGRHTLEITAYGSRVNTFGALHNCNRTLTWFGPDAWKSKGLAFSRAYQLRPCGILVAPRIGEPTE